MTRNAVQPSVWTAMRNAVRPRCQCGTALNEPTQATISTTSATIASTSPTETGTALEIGTKPRFIDAKTPLA